MEKLSISNDQAKIVKTIMNKNKVSKREGLKCIKVEDNKTFVITDGAALFICKHDNQLKSGVYHVIEVVKENKYSSIVILDKSELIFPDYKLVIPKSLGCKFFPKEDIDLSIIVYQTESITGVLVASDYLELCRDCGLTIYKTDKEDRVNISSESIIGVIMGIQK